MATKKKASAKVEWVQNLRRSNASRPAALKKHRGTRSTRKNAAIREY